ncbi:MAG: hypothetical protein KAY24_01260 [Candidatus Eisenbacteria sp.]|nr:hypothetical protein [Candidatus Eisenbacteria bacterium]
MRRLRGIPFDPRFNAFHWISDCWFLTYQIEHSYHKMREAAKRYRETNRPGDNPSASIPELSYYADNTVVRLLSFSDKLALCMLSYFEDFDPNGDTALCGISDVVRVLEASTGRARLGINQALAILGPVLKRRPRVLKRYRHYKIHRREPRIELFGIQAHHDVPYLVRVRSDRDMNMLRSEIKAQYTDPAMQRLMLERSKVLGIHYRNVDANENRRLFSYQRIDKAIKEYRRVCYEGADKSATFLKRRKPFRGKMLWV